ncbi:MAG: hypothetical protein BJ554DRAFT_6646 [Olpidium bornovanus]|uniref:Mitochondrial distribution and morphology protein 10 n=1 Tax=Olpidium bornovanus TaxID=278681 RepID=A0A8H8DK25_9FUNG|nr:MAG: hypothetical protein BJ554DRAFT_6646 [Olpidium bornovanus]
MPASLQSLMQHCLALYLRGTGWSDENQYANLCAASRSMLDFRAPDSLTFHVAKAPTCHFRAAYSLQALPALDGSVGCLYTSKPVLIRSSRLVPLAEMMEDTVTVSDPEDAGYRRRKGGTRRLFCGPLTPHGRPPPPPCQFPDRRRVRRPAPCVPSSRREKERPPPVRPPLPGDRPLGGLVCAPTRRKLAGSVHDGIVSKPAGLQRTRLSSGAGPSERQLTALLRHASGSWSSELSFATEDELFGGRALYTFLGAPEPDDELLGEWKKRWSIGAEVYYTAKERSGGVSAGVRYRSCAPYAPTTAHTDVTYTLNPMMGHMSTCYTSCVGRGISMCARFDYNMYSYESDLSLGAEWRIAEGWRQERPARDDGHGHPDPPEGSVVYSESRGLPLAGAESRSDAAAAAADEGGDRHGGVLKGRISLRRGLALAFEGRVGTALCSLGLHADFSRRNSPLTSIGMDVQYFA